MTGPIHLYPKKSPDAPRHTRYYLIGSALALLLLVVLAKIFEDCLPPAQPPLLCKWPWLQATTIH